MNTEKQKAPRNRTLTLEESEIPALKERLIDIDDLSSFSGNDSSCSVEKILDKTINADLLEALPLLPDGFADLIIIDPPYNLTKDFHGNKFNARTESRYDDYLATWFPLVCKKLKPTGSLYICGDWKCTSSLQRAVEKKLTILNRITWQREKGREATSN